jgi:hypothetical protein
VVNLGRGAYGPQQELIVLKRYGLAYRPRVVIWQLFEGNDLADARQFSEWKARVRQASNHQTPEQFFGTAVSNTVVELPKRGPQVSKMSTLHRSICYLVESPTERCCAQACSQAAALSTSLERPAR